MAPLLLSPCGSKEHGSITLSLFNLPQLPLEPLFLLLAHILFTEAVVPLLCESVLFTFCHHRGGSSRVKEDLCRSNGLRGVRGLGRGEGIKIHSHIDKGRAKEDIVT